MKRFTAAGVVAGLLLLASPVWSHHSQAMYDETKMVTLKGVVAKFQWINPHTHIYIDVTEGADKGKQWEIETNAAVSMAKLGWKRDQFKAGDAITVDANPAKDGSPHGMLRKVTGPDGKEFVMPGNGPQKPK